MLTKRKSLASIFSHHKRNTPSDDHSSSEGSLTSASDESSDDGKSSEESEIFSGGTIREKKLPKIPPSYYDEFTPSANLDALSVVSSDTPLLDEDPFALTPPASPCSSVHSIPPPPSPSPPVVFHPNGPSFLDHPPCQPIKRRNTLSPIVSPYPNGKEFTFPPLPPLPRTSATVKFPSPLSSEKSAFSLHSRPSRPRYLSSPQQPSLDTLAMVGSKIYPQRRKGKVGANLPMEPWNDEETRSLQTVFNVPLSEGRYSDDYYHMSKRLPKPSSLVSSTVVPGMVTKSQVDIRGSYEKHHMRYQSLWKMSDWYH